MITYKILASFLALAFSSGLLVGCENMNASVSPQPMFEGVINATPATSVVSPTLPPLDGETKKFQQLIVEFDQKMRQARQVDKKEILVPNSSYPIFKLKNYKTKQALMDYLQTFCTEDVCSYVMRMYCLYVDGQDIGYDNEQDIVGYHIVTYKQVSVIEHTEEKVTLSVPFAYKGLYEVNPKEDTGTIELIKTNGAWKISKITHWYNDFMVYNYPHDGTSYPLLFLKDKATIEAVIEACGRDKEGNLLLMTIEQDEANGYILKESDKKLLIEDDIRGLSKYSIYLASCEILARHGVIFEREDVNAYFSLDTTWYDGQISEKNFDRNSLTEIEQKNLTFLQSYIDTI